MIKYFIKIILIALLITIIIELIGAYLIFKVRNKKDLLNVLLVNILTNPLLVTLTIYINIYYGLKWRNILIYPLEIIVVLIEGLIYKKYLNYKKINPFVLSVFLNITSYLIGLILNSLIY